MSVTFFAEPGPVVGWTVRCFCPGTGRNFDTYEGAVECVRTHRDSASYDWFGCTDEGCAVYESLHVVARHEEDSPEVNVSNSNAGHLFRVLGLASNDPLASTNEDTRQFEDLFDGGSVDAEDLLGRVLVADAISPADEGTATVEERAAGGARLVTCGRRPGYTQERLGALREIAEWAASRGRSVCWS